MEAIAGLPLVLAVVLCELAVGGATLLLVLDRVGHAPAGFRKLTAVADLAAIAAAAALLPALPSGDLAQRAGLQTGPLAAFAQALPLVAALLAVHAIACFTPWRVLRDSAGGLAIVAGALTLGIAATARPGPEPYDPFALAALPLGALALGGSNAAMLLGHWYLVTPKLSPALLQRAALGVVAALALQAVLVAVSAGRGELAGITQSALWIAVALRIGVGLVMAAGVALGAWWTARMNTQSSTGLLYVGLGCVLAGEVAARVVFFLTGAAL
jgi:hypothetical protein